MTESQDGTELCFPQLLNTSCKKPKPRHSEAIFTFLLPAMCVITVALNLLVIISVSHYRQLHTPTNLLLLSLAVSDFLWGLVVVPLHVLQQTSCWFLGDVMDVLCVFLSLIITSVSVANMLLISVDRYVAVCYPLQYSTRFTVKRVQMCVCLSWLCSVVYNILIIMGDLVQLGRSGFWHEECVWLIDYIPGVVDTVVTFIGPISVIIILYIRVFMVAVSQARAMRTHTAAAKSQRSVTLTTKKSELKAARNLGAVILVFLICFCPYYCATFINDTASFVILTPFFLLNSCLNPVIYALLYPWFGKAVKLIVTLQILQPHSRETSLL